MRRTGKRNRARHLVVPDLAPVGSQHADGLRRIDRASASQAHQAVVTALHKHPNPLLHHNRGRIGHSLVEDLTAQARGSYLRAQSFGKLTLHQERICNNQRSFALQAHEQRGHLGERPSPDPENGWNFDLGYHRLRRLPGLISPSNTFCFWRQPGAITQLVYCSRGNWTA